MKPYAGLRSPKLSTKKLPGESRATTRGAKEKIRNAKRALNKRGRKPLPAEEDPDRWEQGGGYSGDAENYCGGY